MKMGEGALEVICCTKIRAWSLTNIAPGHFTYLLVVLWLSNKPSFQIQPSLDWIICATICLPLPLDIISKVLMRLNVFFVFWRFPAAKRSSCVLVFHETFVPDSMVLVNGKNYKITPDERATAGDSLFARRKFSLS